jgi:hypothetical protein
MTPLWEIQERLDRLETSNCRMKTALSLLLCCAAAVVLMGAASTAPKMIDVEKITLRDSAGNERGQLFASATAWGLVLFNRNGTKAASFVVGSELNALLLSDQDGNMRQTITSNRDESAWSIFRPGSNSSQFQVVDNAQGAALAFRHRANTPRVELGVSSKGSALTLSDSNGEMRSVVSGEELGFASFSKNGSLQWAPGWDKFSPEEQEKMRELTKVPH